MRPSNFPRIPLDQIPKGKVFPMRFSPGSPALEMLRPIGGERLEHSRTYYFRYSDRPSAIRVYGSRGGAESEIESDLVYASSISGNGLIDFFLGLVTPRERSTFLANAVISRDVGKEGFYTDKDKSTGYATHHIIPLTLCSKDNLMLAAFRYGLLDQNGSYNSIDLPGYVHNGSHTNYTNRVEKDLNICKNILGDEEWWCEELVGRSIDAVLDKWREYCQLQKKRHEPL